MDPFIPLALGVGAAAVGVVAGVSYYLEQRRREALHAWAEKRGWAFDAAPADVPHQCVGLRLFNQGHGQRYRHVARGTRDGLELQVGDYQYTTGSGKNARTWHQTVCIVLTPGRRGPPLFVRRQHLFVDAVGKLLGGQDLNFKDDPAFSKAFVVQTSGDDESEARLFLTPGLREFLTRLADRDPQLEVRGEAMLLHRGRLLGPEDLDGLLTDAINLRRHWP